MAITDIRYGSDGSSGNGKGTDSGSSSFSYRATWKVKCDSASDQSDIIWTYLRTHTQFNAVHLPWFGRTFKYASGRDTSSVCREIDVDYVRRSEGWHEVTASYESLTGPSADDPKTMSLGVDGKKTDDPLKWLPEISTGWTSMSIPIEQAEFVGTNPPGIPTPFLRPGRVSRVCNSAMTPFDPQPEEELAIKVIRITRNVNFYQGLLHDRVQGTVNRNVVAIAPINGNGFRHFVPAMHGWMKHFGADLAEENGKQFWRETKEVWIHPRAWVRDFLDHGLDELWVPGMVGHDGTEYSAGDFPANRPWDHKRIKDEAGYPIAFPVNFDGSGHALGPTNPGVVYLRWLTKTTDTWNGIQW